MRHDFTRPSDGYTRPSLYFLTIASRQTTFRLGCSAVSSWLLNPPHQSLDAFERWSTKLYRRSSRAFSSDDRQRLPHFKPPSSLSTRRTRSLWSPYVACPESGDAH